MDWLSLYSPDRETFADSTRPLPRPSDAASRAARVKEMALRHRRGERITGQPGDWNAQNDMDLSMVHDRIGWMGSDRRANGTDEDPELVVHDALDEFADDHADLPDGWLEQELAEFRERHAPQTIQFKEAA